MPRRALITGASSGIGAAVARSFAAGGADVWLTYSQNIVDVETVADTCRGSGVEAHVARLDLRSEDSIEALIGEVREAWGALHVLVNNGGTCPYRAYSEITIDEWDMVLETNARGTFLLTRAALPLLRLAEGDRAVVNVSSIAGQMGALQTGMHYAASKAAILAITRSFARLLAGEGIRVNAVTPGPVFSNITRELGDDGRAALEAAVPMGRFGLPEEVAATIVLLGSPESAFTTGATYDVNGGVRID